MRWTCKLCTFFSGNQKRILEHYQNSHRHYGRNCPLPCIYKDCAQYFRSKKSLHVHLKNHGIFETSSALFGFKLKCLLCEFKKEIALKQYIAHLGKHLRSRETVTCPFNLCAFKSNVFSSFTSHKSRCHPQCRLRLLSKSVMVTSWNVKQLIHQVYLTVTFMCHLKIILMNLNQSTMTLQK